MPIVGSTRVINTHIAASLPFADAESEASKANQKREIDQLIEAAAASGGGAAILIGDFNTSDKIHPENYQRIVDAGYDDAFLVANESSASSEAVTWDAANPLNRHGRFRYPPSQRIDHVFVAKCSRRSLLPIAADIVFKERSVKLGSGQQTPLSDHYGLLVTVALQSQ
jgi:endonuclease/exonuclease/phosphatase family metal-dependent hydrolase